MTEPINVSWPDNGTEANLTLEVNFGELFLTPGATELVEGSVTYNVSELKPEVVLSGRNVGLRPANDIGLAGLFFSFLLINIAIHPKLLDCLTITH